MDFTLDRGGLVFVCFSLVIACWAVFDTERFLRVLSYNRKTTFSHLADGHSSSRNNLYGGASLVDFG